MANSVTAGTQKNYAAVIMKLEEFCRSNRIKDKFSPAAIELFVTHLSQQKNLCHSTVQANLSAVRHHCHMNNVDIHFDTPRLKLLLRGIKKTDNRTQYSVALTGSQKITYIAYVLQLMSYTMKPVLACTRPYLY